MTRKYIPVENPSASGTKTRSSEPLMTAWKMNSPLPPP